MFKRREAGNIYYKRDIYSLLYLKQLDDNEYQFYYKRRKKKWKD